MKDLFAQFFTNYGMEIIATIVTAIAGYIGLALKRVYTNRINTKEKKAVVDTCVQAVEQLAKGLYEDLHGEEKFEKAREYAMKMLEEKGIPITETELRMLIEAAVAEFNGAFHVKMQEDTKTVQGVADPVAE